MSRTREVETVEVIPPGRYAATVYEIEDPKRYGASDTPAYKFVFLLKDGPKIDALASSQNDAGSLSPAMKVVQWKNAIIGVDAPFDPDLMEGRECVVDLGLNQAGYNKIVGDKPYYGIYAVGTPGVQPVPGVDTAAPVDQHESAAAPAAGPGYDATGQPVAQRPPPVPAPAAAVPPPPEPAPDANDPFKAE